MEEELEEQMPTLIQVPEEFIKSSAEVLSRVEPNNVFHQILAASVQFREAGMTPIFLYDFVNKNVQLVTMETYGRKLH